MPWTPLPWLGGKVKCDRNSNTRWSADLVLPPSVNTAPGAINTFGTRIRIQRGFDLPRVGPELVPWGVYRVDDMSILRKGSVSLSLVGLEQQIIDDRFLTTRKIGGPTVSAATAIRQLVLESVPDATFQFSAKSSNDVLSAIIEQKDRWGVIDAGVNGKSIATTIGAEAYFDGRGVFVVQDIPTVYNHANMDLSKYGVIMNVKEGASRDGIYNIVRVSSEKSDGTTKLGPVFAWDRVPTSPTYAGVNPVASIPSYEEAPFGRKVRYYSSPFFTSVAQMEAVAVNLVAESLGQKRTLSFDTFSNPALLAGDVVDIGDGEKYLIDAWSADLRGGVMNCDTRASRADVGDIAISDGVVTTG
jgi:hypothetical protein